MSALLGSLMSVCLVGGEVGFARLSPDGSRAIYAQGPDTQHLELFTTKTDGLGGTISLSGPRAEEGGVFCAEYMPDGQHVVYFLDPSGDGTHDVYSVPSPGGTPVRLNDPRAPGATVGLLGVRGFVPLDGSRRILFAANAARLENVDLFVAPVDGQGAPIRLSAGTAAGVDVVNVTLTPDEQHVVFLAGVDPGHRDVYVAPTDGSAPALLLSTLGDNVTRFAVTADGTRVVYTAPHPFSVPIDGGGAPIVLGTAVAHSLHALPDGAVLFRSGATLRRVPADGSGPVVLLSSSVGSTPFVSSDGGTAVFLENQFASDAVIAVRTDGAAPQDTLLAVPAGALELYTIAPDGRSVFTTVGGVLGVVPFDHGEPYRTLAAGVSGFQFVHGSEHLVLTRTDALGLNPQLFHLGVGTGETPGPIGAGVVDDIGKRRGKRTLARFPARVSRPTSLLTIEDGSVLCLVPWDGSQAPLPLNL